MSIILSPLEQFEITKIIPIHLGNFNLSFTNSSLFMIICGMTIVLIMIMSLHNSTLIPSRWQSLVEMIYEFLYDLLYSNTGEKGIKYFPLIFSVFTFILSANLIGMIPYSFTVTSHIIVTFSLGFSLFIGITIIGFIHHGLHFFSIVIPPGAMPSMVPFLAMIETVSYLIRPLSLSIRLFANMMAGHTLLKIIAGFGWSMFSIGGIFYLFGLVPMIILFGLMGLELGVAIIQAYVFTLLICLYISDVIHLHH